MSKPCKFHPFTNQRKKWYGDQDDRAPQCMSKLTSGVWRSVKDVKVEKLKRQLGR